MEQKKYSLDQKTLEKIGKSFLIAFAGFLATYLEDLIPMVDFGEFTPLVVALNSVLINAIREYIKGK